MIEPEEAADLVESMAERWPDDPQARAILKSAAEEIRETWPKTNTRTSVHTFSFETPLAEPP